LLLVCVLPLPSAHEAAGATGTRHSPRPPWGRKINARLGRFAPRGRERAFDLFCCLKISKSMCVRSAPQARSSKRKLLLSGEFDNFFHRLCGTRASNRVCSSKRTFRFPGWRCFRRPATSSISRSRRCSTKRWSASWRWRKRIDGRRAILPRGVLEDRATASVRRVGSIRAVEGRGAMTSPLDASAAAAAYESWVSGRVSCRLQRALPASRMPQISEKALF
jgi:hypothetical protein